MGYTPPILTRKICCSCKEDKPIDQFRTKFRKATWRPNYICKSCDKIKSAEKYIKNKERILAYNRKWYAENKEARNEIAKIWREENRDRANAAIRINAKRRYRDDPQYRFKCIVRARVLEAIKTGEGCKCGGTKELIGADWVDVRNRIASLFTGEMSWDNHGKLWHIDHHIPCAAWDMTNDHHQRACFNWRNLRPIHRMDNFKKNDTLPPGWQDYMALLLEVTREPIILAP